MKKTKREFKKGTVITFVLMIFFVLVFCFSGYKIIDWYLANNKNAKIQKDIKDFIKIEDDSFKVDFEALKKKNSDAVAWLIVNNTNINYAVVKGSDNSYYLNHNFDKEYNISGWVFADYHNKFDGTDKNTIIYGHNTMDGSMFGSLKNILKKDWQENEENLDVTLITETGESTYRVFSVYQIETEDYYIKTDFNSDEEFNKFINTLVSRSVYNFKTEVTIDDEILTLSTCSASGKERVVLHAVKIKE